MQKGKRELDFLEAARGCVIGMVIVFIALNHAGVWEAARVLAMIGSWIWFGMLLFDAGLRFGLYLSEGEEEKKVAASDDIGIYLL